LLKQEIDTILLQEVTRSVFDDVRVFEAYTNTGTTERRTAILTRDRVQLTNISCLPTGREIAAQFQNVTIVDIYALSGAERRRDKENLFSNELPYLLRDIPSPPLVGGDLNSVLTNLDATGHPNFSRTCKSISEDLTY
jgi:exonuclease III